MTTGLPRNQPARNSNASASLHFRFISGFCTAQLTFNTDGIINKLVTVFAGDCTVKTVDNSVINTPRPQSPLRYDIGAPRTSDFNEILYTLTSY